MTYIHHEIIAIISLIISIISYRYKNKEIEKKFSLSGEFGIFSLNYFYTQHTTALIIFIMLYFTSLALTYLIIGSLYLLTIFIQFLSPLCTSGNHKSDLFSYEFFFCLLVCFWNVIDLHIMLCLFLVYNILIQYSYAFQKDHCDKSSYHAPP